MVILVLMALAMGVLGSTGVCPVCAPVEPTDAYKWATIELAVGMYCTGDISNETKQWCAAYDNAFDVLKQHAKDDVFAMWCAAARHINEDVDPWRTMFTVAPVFLRALNPCPDYLPSRRMAFFNEYEKKILLDRLISAHCHDAHEPLCTQWLKWRAPRYQWIGCIVSNFPFTMPTGFVALWEHVASPGTSAHDPWHLPLVQPEWVLAFLRGAQVQDTIQRDSWWCS